MLKFCLSKHILICLHSSLKNNYYVTKYLLFEIGKNTRKKDFLNVQIDISFSSHLNLKLANVNFATNDFLRQGINLLCNLIIDLHHGMRYL